MKRAMPLGGLVGLVLLALAACAGPGPGTVPTATPPDLTQPTPTHPPETTPEMTLPPTGDIPADLVDPMIEEVAAIAAVAESDVTIVRAQAVTWNDGSLGCPEPGGVYTQALVDGYWLVLSAGGQEYDLRAGQDGQFRFCPPGQGRPPLEP